MCRVLLGGFLAFVLSAAACTGEQAGRPASDLSPIPAANARSAEGTRGLPDAADALPDIDPASYRDLLRELRGTPVVVNIWGSWCGPCREEAPHLREAHEAVGGQVQFIGIDILDSRESAREFIREFGWTYPSFFDPSAGGEVRNNLGYLGQPVTIFYDDGGRKVADFEGPISAEQLDQRIRSILAERRGSVPSSPAA